MGTCTDLLVLRADLVVYSSRYGFLGFDMSCVQGGFVLWVCLNLLHPVGLFIYIYMTKQFKMIIMQSISKPDPTCIATG